MSRRISLSIVVFWVWLKSRACFVFCVFVKFWPCWMFVESCWMLSTFVGVCSVLILLHFEWVVLHFGWVLSHVEWVVWHVWMSLVAFWSGWILWNFVAFLFGFVQKLILMHFESVLWHFGLVEICGTLSNFVNDEIVEIRTWSGRTNGHIIWNPNRILGRLKWSKKVRESIKFQDADMLFAAV